MNSNQIKSNNNASSKPKRSNEPALKIIPLGGLHEIGKNTCIFEYQDDII